MSAEAMSAAWRRRRIGPSGARRLFEIQTAQNSARVSGPFRSHARSPSLPARARPQIDMLRQVDLAGIATGIRIPWRLTPQVSAPEKRDARFVFRRSLSKVDDQRAPPCSSDVGMISSAWRRGATHRSPRRVRARTASGSAFSKCIAGTGLTAKV